ncbi:MAG: FMN-binding protein, partial [Anaerovoracaceae bacterium]
DAPTQGPETMIDLIAPTKGSEVFLGKGRGYRYLSGQSAGADQDSLNQAYILVAVEVKDKQVKNIQVVQHKEDTPYIKKANPFLVKQVLKDKGLEESKRSIEEKSGVIYDTVSGATLSSNGILEGIEEAIKEARLRGSLGKDFGEIKDPAEKPPTPPVPPTPIIPPTPPVPPTPIIPPTPPVPPAPIIPPTPPVPPTSEYQSYFGLGKGYRYEEGQKQGKSPEELLSTLLKVEVVVKDKKIEKIQVVTHQEDKLYMKMVNPYLVNKMKETEAIEGIAKEVSEKKGTHYDQISGATKSGNAISQATVAAVKEAIKAGALENGYGGVMK